MLVPGTDQLEHDFTTLSAVCLHLLFNVVMWVAAVVASVGVAVAGVAASDNRCLVKSAIDIVVGKHPTA